MSHPGTLNQVLFIKVSVYDNGALSVEGHLGDKALALRVLQHAMDSIRAQVKEQPLIVVPNRDVDLPAYPHEVKPLGDMAPRDRGDQ
jgi:hypothetical protein